jgi:hypothetical protein
MALSNEYARLLTWYEEVPKAVLAAIAVSYATAGGDHLEQAEANVAKEWKTLNENGIVQQKPSAKALRAAEKGQDQ